MADGTPRARDAVIGRRRHDADGVKRTSVIKICQLELDRRGNVIACTPTKFDNCEQISCACDD